MSEQLDISDCCWLERDNEQIKLCYTIGDPHRFEVKMVPLSSEKAIEIATWILERLGFRGAIEQRGA